MFEEILAKLARSLERGQIPYMVIGGQAVLLYGEPRLTRDIDLTLGLDPSQVDRLKNVLDELELQILVENPKEFVEQTFVLPALEKKSGIRIDFVFSLSGYERDAITRAKKVRIGRSDVCYIGLEDLLVHKIIAGRPRDLEDARSILLKNPTFNQSFIQKCLAELGQEAGEDFTKRFQNLLQSLGK